MEAPPEDVDLAGLPADYVIEEEADESIMDEVMPVAKHFERLGRIEG